MSTPDVRVIDAGSIVLFMPISEQAKDWCATHLPDDCPMHGDSYAVERRYAQDIYDGMLDAGLQFLQPVRH